MVCGLVICLCMSRPNARFLDWFMVLRFSCGFGLWIGCGLGIVG